MVTFTINVSFNLDKEYFDIDKFANDFRKYISDLYCMKGDDVLVNASIANNETCIVLKNKELIDELKLEEIRKAIQNSKSEIKVLDDSNDAVNSPNHYKLPGLNVEVIDVLKAGATPEEYKGYLKLTARAYLLRAGRKDDELQDIKKCMKYLEWLEEELK